MLVCLGCGGADVASCTAPQRPLDLHFEVSDPFPELVGFAQPVGLYQAAALPERMFVLEKAGRVLAFDVRNPGAGVHVVADLSARVRARKECGLLGLAFHPGFERNGQVVLSYCAATDGTRLRYARYAYDFASATIDVDSEDVFLELPTPRNMHQGGQVRFDPRGYLLTAVGDTGPHRDPDGHAQNPGDLLGDFLRLDIDGGRPYAIPPDNPFAESGALAGRGRPEVYASGFRNPWSFSLDRETGEIWSGDVGFETTEEVDWVRPGRNYGWPLMEGPRCREDCAGRDLTPPVASFRNRGNSAVIGGYVYRGEGIAGLTGAYVFADFGGGALYAIFDPYGSAETRVIHGSTGLTPSAFHEDPAGELYFTDIGKGRIHQLVPSTRRADDGFPRTLGDTGCVSFGTNGRPAPAGGAVAFDVRMPLWSDAADKTRYVNAAGMQASITAEGDLDFPIGTVLVKLFERGGELLEGRLLVHHEDGAWAGYSYEWDPGSNDALLLEEGKTKPVGTGTWTYPSREDCFACHTSAAGFALGPELDQLAAAKGPSASPGQSDEPPDPVPWAESLKRAEPFAWRQQEGDDEHWVRSYLHANCSHCHRPGGAANADIDLRLRTNAAGDPLPLDAMQICDVPPTAGDLGIAGAALLAPGAPERSLLLQRMAVRGEGQMPPLARDQVDALAMERVARWIAGLSACR